MAGFGVNLEACIWKKVDALVFKVADKLLEMYIQDLKDEKKLNLAKQG